MQEELGICWRTGRIEMCENRRNEVGEGDRKRDRESDKIY